MALMTPRSMIDRGHAAFRRRPAGFSLTELLVASAIALVVMGAVAQLFAVFSGALSGSQTTVDLAARMRATAWQLRQDLAGTTVDLVPWTPPEANAGYFELTEGTQRDTTLTLSGTPTTNLEGDTDDSLLFTTRSASGPFVGRFNSDKVESSCAEVAWFCRESGDQPVPGTKMYNLYRRQLLVVGYVGRAPFSAGNANSTAGTLPNTTYDISLRADGGMLVPNSLGDLTKRENRFMHGTTFPYALQNDGTSARLLPTATFDSTTRVWEDVLLTNVIAFDVRVFDPSARADTTTTPTRYPGDPGYVAGTGTTGAYVDLGWGGGTPTAIGGTFPPAGQSAFQSMGMRVANAPRSSAMPVATYDTWSLHYEFNGEDDDADGLIDEGTNAVDDNADQLPDNPAEYETSPPYPVPLRGIEVRLRCYEPSAKQVRQVTVRHTFIKK